jgi:DNA-binding CsgD family transcriptional regulator
MSDVYANGAEASMFSPTEREVLAHLVGLRTAGEIAASMHMSVDSVRDHVRNILRKIGEGRR